MDSRVQPPIKDLLLGALRQFDLVSSLDAGRLRGFLATSSGASRLLRVSSASLGRGPRPLSTRPRRKTRIYPVNIFAPAVTPLPGAGPVGVVKLLKQIGVNRRRC